MEKLRLGAQHSSASVDASGRATDSRASPLLALPSVPTRSPSDPVLPPPHARQQELDNLLHEKRYLRALGLAISLDRPHTVLTVIQGQCCLGLWGRGRSLGPSRALP